MQTWFWWIPKVYWDKNIKEIDFLYWRFIFKWVNTKIEPHKKSVIERAEDRIKQFNKSTDERN